MGAILAAVGTVASIVWLPWHQTQGWCWLVAGVAGLGWALWAVGAATWKTPRGVGFAAPAKDLWFGGDKAAHALASMGVVVFFGAMGLAFHATQREALVAGVFCAVIVGLAKEGWDAQHGGRWSWKDVVADAVGIALVASAELLIPNF